MQAISSTERTSQLFAHLTEDHSIQSDGEASSSTFGFDLSRIPRHFQHLVHQGLSQMMKPDSNDRHHLTQQVIHALAETNLAPSWPPHVEPSLLSSLFNPMNANLASLWGDAILSDRTNSHTDTWTQPLRALVTSEHRKEQVFGTEVVAGFLRSCFRCATSPSSRLWKETLEPIMSMIFSGEIGTSADWPTALRYSMSGLAPTQYMACLRETLESSGVLSDTTALSFLEQSESV